MRYAQDRYITVVPEIDMPGHTNAAIAAYPQLGCSARRRASSAARSRRGCTRARRWGGASSAPTARVVYTFVDDVVREIAAMTPGPYFHIGGDEVHVLQLPQYVKFVERVQDIVYNNGKTYMGWEEIGRGRLRPTTVVQQWKSDSVPPAVTQGAKLVMSPANKTYLDMKYDARHGARAHVGGDHRAASGVRLGADDVHEGRARGPDPRRRGRAVERDGAATSARRCT